MSVSLAEYMPAFVKEWDFEKNTVSPHEIAAFSTEYVWWKCEEGHNWRTQVGSRCRRKSQCPYCKGLRSVAGKTDLKTIYPDLAKEWDYDKNEDLKLEDVLPGAHQKVWWKCSKGHSFSVFVFKRTKRGDGCPYCSGRYAIPNETDLGTVYPKVKKYWDAKNNGSILEYTANSHRKVNWVCQDNHSWVRAIHRQVANNTCPYCAGQKLIKGVNDLATLYPELAKEYDEEKNGMKASDLKASTHVNCYWKCSKNHSWKTQLHNRLQGKGCPYCAGKYPVKGENDLATLYPWLLNEWCYDLNLKTPDEYLPKSNKKVWWWCEKGHIWKSLISERTRGTGCPECIKER